MTVSERIGDRGGAHRESAGSSSSRAHPLLQLQSLRHAEDGSSCPLGLVVIVHRAVHLYGEEYRRVVVRVG